MVRNSCTKRRLCWLLMRCVTLLLKAGFVLSKLDREGVTGITVAQVEKRFGWKPKNKKGRDKTATRAKEMGWYYQQGNRRTPAQLLKLQ